MWLRIFSYFFYFTIVQAGLCYPLYYNSRDTKLLQASIASQNPEVGALFFREPSMFGYDPALNQNQSVTFMGVLILALLILLFAIVILYFNFVRILYKNKNQLSDATYKLQKLLFKALYLQMLLAVILLIIPIGVCLTLAMFGFKWISKFSLFVFMVISTHAIADFAILAYFIKPYRIFILGLFKAFLGKIGFKFNSATLTPILISTQVTSSVVIHR
uniref:Uncharacterized protein n=1 Tax=Panagrolaimus davidi TaxID=227884 RepID=A0A914PUY5_9BILA